MGLRDHIDKALDAWADRPEGAPSTVTGEVGGLSTEISVRDTDRLGVVVDHIEVKGVAGALDVRSERIAASLRPVGERLIPVEVDPKLGGAILRTHPEDMRGGRFFQVDIGSDRAKLTRHHVDQAGARQAQQFGLTRDQLGELLDELEGALKD
jgi:hypothetical protein